MACNQIRIHPQSTHITYLACNPRVHSMKETPQGDSLGQTPHNPWAVGGWQRTGILGVKSPKKENPDVEIKQKICQRFVQFSTRESCVVHSGIEGKMKCKEHGPCFLPPSPLQLRLGSAHLASPSAPQLGSQGWVNTHVFCLHIKLDPKHSPALFPNESYICFPIC